LELPGTHPDGGGAWFMEKLANGRLLQAKSQYEKPSPEAIEQITRDNALF
jgi:hypothetical protein